MTAIKNRGLGYLMGWGSTFFRSALVLVSVTFLGAGAVSLARAEDQATTESPGDSKEGTPFSGRVFTDFYIPTGNFFDGALQQISGSLWLQADPKLGDNSSAHFILTADQFAASSIGGRTGFQPGIREAYLGYVKSGLEVRAGKMIIPWGKSDVVNPTDLLSAKDFTFFNPDEEVRRMGGISFFASWTPHSGDSPLTFTVVGTPVFPQSRLLLAPGQVSANILGATSVQSPPATLSNSETALKMAYAGKGWDATVLVYRGWNHLPEFQVLSISSSSVTVSQVFHQYRALGADGSVTFGQWIVRAEAAYIWTENDDGQNPLIQPSHLDSVLGLERPIGSDFRIQGQLLLRYFPRYLSPSQISDPNPLFAAVYQQVAQTNALIQNYQDSIRPSASLRISYSNDQNRWSGEIFLLGNFLGGGLLVRPQLGYGLTDALKATLGLDYYTGPSDRPLGVLSPYNALYSELKYSF
jgi:hypothetical protein